MLRLTQYLLTGIGIAVAVVLCLARGIDIFRCGYSSDACPDSFFRLLEAWIVEHHMLVLMASVAYGTAVLLVYPREAASALRAQFKPRFFVQLSLYVGVVVGLLVLCVQYPALIGYLRLPWWSP